MIESGVWRLNLMHKRTTIPIQLPMELQIQIKLIKKPGKIIYRQTTFSPNPWKKMTKYSPKSRIPNWYDFCLFFFLFFTSQELDNLNDMMFNYNFNPNPGFPQFLDKNNLNPDLFLTSNNPALQIDSNLFSTFPGNFGSSNLGNPQNGLMQNNNDMLNQNGLFFANNNFLLHNNLGLGNMPNSNLYEDFVKNQGDALWYQGGNQFPFQTDKNIMNSNMFDQNPNLLGNLKINKNSIYIDNPVLYNFDEYPLKPGQDLNPAQ